MHRTAEFSGMVSISSLRQSSGCSGLFFSPTDDHQTEKNNRPPGAGRDNSISSGPPEGDAKCWEAWDKQIFQEIFKKFSGLFQDISSLAGTSFVTKKKHFVCLGDLSPGQMNWLHQFSSESPVLVWPRQSIRKKRWNSMPRWPQGSGRPSGEGFLSGPSSLSSLEPS